MHPEDRQEHWQSTYQTKGEQEVSWFQDSPEPSLGLIEGCAAAPDAIIDIGGGASRLIDALLHRGYRDATVLDLSSSALTAAKARIDSTGDHVQWIVADVTKWEPDRTYAVWHDRAAFHFLTAAADREAYIARLSQALKPGGHAIIATFAPDGPERCSGLPVVRYDADSLAETLGPAFQLTGTQRHLHATPWGSTQSFQFSIFRHQPIARS